MFYKTLKTNFKMDFSLLLTLLPKRWVEAPHTQIFAIFLQSKVKMGFLTWIKTQLWGLREVARIIRNLNQLEQTSEEEENVYVIKDQFLPLHLSLKIYAVVDTLPNIGGKLLFWLFISFVFEQNIFVLTSTGGDHSTLPFQVSTTAVMFYYSKGLAHINTTSILYIIFERMALNSS